MKLKVIVYAICKNEEQFVDRWIDSMKEADKIYVLDTGSCDDTINKLKNKNVIVKQETINPWRFDVARNKSLDLVDEDADICVCTDLDEVFNKGWRNELEKSWKNNTTRCRYIYNWSLNENNLPVISFYYEKIHKRKGFKWIYPVHEILEYDKKEEYVTNEKIILNHYPDKNKSRNNYLELLKLSIKENPNNDRNMHYLGREYMYHGKWNKSIDTLIQHLNLETANWKDERCASMRFIARCYINIKRYNEANMWLNKAILEAPYLRDSYVEMAFLNYELKDYKSVKKNCHKALKIIKNEKTYVNEIFSWDYTIYDLLSISYYYLENYYSSYKYIKKALKLNPNNLRLQKNKTIIKEKLSN